MEKNNLNFKGGVVEGSIDLNTAKMICIPSKEKYDEVHLSLDEGDAMTIAVSEVIGRSLSFEEKKKLGYEIAKRWNSALIDV